MILIIEGFQLCSMLAHGKPLVDAFLISQEEETPKELKETPKELNVFGSNPSQVKLFNFLYSMIFISEGLPRTHGLRYVNPTLTTFLY
jgi:hypothetical protein